MFIFLPLMIKTISQSCRQPASVLSSLWRDGIGGLVVGENSKRANLRSWMDTLLVDSVALRYCSVSK